MARVRVVCKQPPLPPPRAGCPELCGPLADISDVTVTVLKADGTEEPMNGVRWVRWEAGEGGEPNRLTMQFLDAEVDVEAEVELAVLKG